MRLTGSRAYAKPVPTPTMPPGLVEIMEGLAKDVLKNNPENVYEFCATHMEKLIELRDGPSPQKKQLSLEQRIAKAQERIRQRIKNRQLQYDRDISEHPTEKIVHKQNLTVKENINTSPAQPVIHEEDLSIKKEVEIFHEPNITLASNGTSADKVPHDSQEVTEIIEKPQLVHGIKEDGHYAAQKLETGKSSENNTEVLEENIISVEPGEKTDFGITHEPEHIAVVAEQTKEAQDLDKGKNDVDITDEPEHIVVVPEQTKEAQDLDTEKNDVDITHKTEHIAVIAEQTKEAQDFEGEKTDVDISHKTEHIAVTAEQTKEAVDLKGEKTDVDITYDPEHIVVVAERTKEAQDLDREKTDVDITHEPEHIVVVAEQTKEAQDLDREKSDIDITHKTEHIAVVAEQTKEAQHLDKESTEHVEMISTHGGNNEETLIETEPTAGGTGNTFEDKTNNLNNEAQGKEVVGDDLNDVTSTLLLASKTVAALSNKSDVTQTEQEVADEQKLDIKEEITDSNTDNTLEEKTDNFNNEAQAKDVVGEEFNQVASTLLLANRTVGALSSKSDVTTTEIKVTEEPQLEKKEEKIDTAHEDALFKKFANETELEKRVDDVVNEQKITSVEECTDQEKNADHIQSKESIECIAHSEDNNTVEQNNDNLFPKSENTAVEEISNRKIETPPLTHSSQQDVPVLPSTDNESKEKQNSIPSMEDAHLSANQMVTVDVTKKSNIQNEDDTENRDIFKGQGYEPNNKELTPAHSEKNIVNDNGHAQGGTTVEYDKDTISESEATTENTAVSGMDLETAAITIQKVFRTFLFSKSRASTLEDTVHENSLDEDIEKKVEPEYVLTSANLNKERRTLGISRMDTVLQTVNEEKSLSLSDDSSLSSAATTIQAHVRGFLVRNRLASNKTASSSSLVNSDGPSTSLDGDANEPKKTILNIHIVPERGQFMSRDESLLTSIDLPLDNSPPSSINLHPLGYDKSERRKQLKREDAIQSISPPSNNSGKLSEEVDSVKEALNEHNNLKHEQETVALNNQDKPHEVDTESCDTTLTISSTAETVVEAESYNPREILSSPEHNPDSDDKNHEVVTSSDEMDVVTPSTITAKTTLVDTEDNYKPKLIHSGEFHDIVVQTQVKRSEPSVVRGE